MKLTYKLLLLICIILLLQHPLYAYVSPDNIKISKKVKDNTDKDKKSEEKKKKKELINESEFDKSDALIMAAAVSDFRPIIASKQKIKKKNEDLTLELTRNPDILEILGRTKSKSQIIIGFSAESENLEKNAFEKLQKKKIDMIVANDITIPDIGFGSDENTVTIISKDGSKDVLPRQPKTQIAKQICIKLVDIFDSIKQNSSKRHETSKK